MPVERVCLAESRFFNIVDNDYEDLLRSPTVFLLPNGNSYLTDTTGELATICPTVEPVTWFYDGSFITDNTGNFDSGDYKFLRGHKVRFKSNGAYNAQYLEAEYVDEKINLPVFGEVSVSL